MSGESNIDYPKGFFERTSGYDAQGFMVIDGRVIVGCLLFLLSVAGTCGYIVMYG